MAMRSEAGDSRKGQWLGFLGLRLIGLEVMGLGLPKARAWGQGFGELDGFLAAKRRGSGGDGLWGWDDRKAGFPRTGGPVQALTQLERSYLSPRMRPFISFLFCSFLLSSHAQIALDDLFISERWFLNAGASFLDCHGVDGKALRDAERIRTYALDEPYYWEKRVYLRVEPKDNPALSMSVPMDSIMPFIDIVNSAVASGEVTVWNDLDYVGSDAVNGKEPIVAAPIVLKVDFHIDTVTLRAVPHIVGLSVERPGVGYAHYYYPELSYALRKYKVRSNKNLITMDAYFKEFRFKASWVDCSQVASTHACKPIQPSLEQQAELDALTELFLLERMIERDAVIRSGKRSASLDLHPYGPVKASLNFDNAGNLAEVTIKKGDRLISSLHLLEGRPDGPYRAFFPDGSLREEGLFSNGLREGKWNSWFPNRSIRSHRNYHQGKLHGLQQVYYSSGQLWLEYGMANGEYEGPHKTWYEDGELKASGTMHEGFISGEWDYTIRIQPALIEHINTYNEAYYHLPAGIWQDGVINYHVTVTDSCEPGPMNSCLFDRCIQWAFSDVR